MKHELVSRLISIQQAEGLSDRRFAIKLGLSNGLWSGVRSGERTMGKKALLAIEKLYPGLKPLVDSYWLEYLRSDFAEQGARAVG